MARVGALCALLFMALRAWADKTAADYFVKLLPGAPDGPLLKMHAGYAIPGD
jgi:carboxypeptidase D